MRFVRLICALALAAGGSLPARAELPPQFTSWADFAAVTSDTSIPHLLGVVDRIDRVQSGKFIVRSGACSVEVNVIRAAATSPDGKPIAGPSRITRVEISGKRCNQ
jgi:hypothetical protein